MNAIANKPLTDRWFKLRLDSQIEEAYACEDRFQFYRCGRRAYKSEIMKRKGVLKSLWPGKYGPRLQLFTAPTQKQAKKIFWEDLIKLSPRAWIKNINRTELSIEYILGSTIEVAGLDQPQRIEGRGYDDIYVDESADVKPSAIAISIMPALADRQGSLTRAGVPKRTGKGARDYNRAFDYVKRNGRIKGTEFKASAFSWKSSTVLSEQELAVQRAMIDEKDFREQFEATIETAGGGIFHSWGSDNIRDVKYDPTKPIILGVDLNVSPMSWVLAHEIDGDLCVFDELWRLDTHTQECLDLVVSSYGTHRAGWVICGDATSQSRNVASSITNYQMIENEKRLINKRIIMPKSNPNVLDRFACMNAKIRNANGKTGVYINKKCVKLVEDIETDAYKEGTVKRDESDKMRGHMCDALGYVIYALYPIRTAQEGKSGIATF